MKAAALYWLAIVLTVGTIIGVITLFTIYIFTTDPAPADTPICIEHAIQAFAHPFRYWHGINPIETA